MSDASNYRGHPPNTCGYAEAEIEARAVSKSAQLWKVQCLNGTAHKNDDSDPSAFYYPMSGWYGCNVCGKRGFATDRLFSTQKGRTADRQPSRNGVSKREFLPDRIPENATLTGTYPYKRSTGEVIHRIRRYDWIKTDDNGRKRSRKEYLPQHLEKGKWKLGTGPTQWQPYNADKLAKAKVVYIVEGEKCANALSELTPLDTTVVTSAFGTNSAWKTDWACLRKRIEDDACGVLFIPDCDAAGEKYIHSVAWELKIKTIEVIRVDNSGRGDGYDVADWLSEGNSWNDLPAPVLTQVKSKEEFDERKRATEKATNGKSHRVQETAYDREIGLISVDERIDRNRAVAARRVHWLIHQFIAAGQTTLIYGDSGVGKTTIVRSLVKHIVEATDPFDSNGKIDEDRGKRGRAIWWLGEEDLALTKPKFSAADISTDDVDMLDKGHKWSCEDTIEVQVDGSRQFLDVSPHTQLLNRIDQASADGKPYRVIVIDPLSKMIGDTNKADLFERRWDETIVTLEARGLAVIGIVHPRKDNPVNSTLEASLKGTERLFSLPRVVAYARASTSKALLRQARENDNGVTHRNPIRDRFSTTGNGELNEDSGLIGVLCPLKNSHERPELLQAWQYSIIVKDDVGAAKFSSTPWRAADFDYLELDGKSFGAAVAAKYVVHKREKQTKQEQLAAVQLEDQVVESASRIEFLNGLFEKQSEWSTSDFRKAVEQQGFSYNSGSFLRSREKIAVFNRSTQVWTRKPKHSIKES